MSAGITWRLKKLYVRKLLASPVIHADETPINVRGVTQYVWTFTNDKYVVFKLSQNQGKRQLRMSFPRYFLEEF